MPARAPRREITQLSQDAERLSEADMARVLQMLREEHFVEEIQSGEGELEMDALPVHVLRSMQKFVAGKLGKPVPLAARGAVSFTDMGRARAAAGAGGGGGGGSEKGKGAGVPSKSQLEDQRRLIAQAAEVAAQRASAAPPAAAAAASSMSSVAAPSASPSSSSSSFSPAAAGGFAFEDDGDMLSPPF